VRQIAAGRAIREDVSMVYRVPPPSIASLVVWGPFPLRGFRLCGGIAALGLGLLVAWFALSTTLIHCTRMLCTEDAQPLGMLRDVRVDREMSYGKNNRPIEWGVLVLTLDRGERRCSRVLPEVAHAAEAELRAFLADPARSDVRVELHQSRGFAVFAVGLLALAVGLIVSSLRAAGRLRLDIDGTRDRIVITRTLFGLSLRRRSVGVADARAVEVEWGELPDPWRTRGTPAERGGRVVVVTATERVPLAPRLHRGYTVHLTAAAALRVALDCPPQSDNARAVDGAAFPRVNPSFARWYGRLPYAWIGLTCGALLGMGLFIGFGLAVGAIHGGALAEGFWFWGGAVAGAVAGVALAWRLTDPARAPR
jgi:hypothetical protein